MQMILIDTVVQTNKDKLQIAKISKHLPVSK